ncbi:hypothetical protein Tco_0931855 [Tanacetum coccineum]
MAKLWFRMFKVDGLKVMRAMLEIIKPREQDLSITGLTDAVWFKDKMILAQLQATTNFKADHVDAYDSDCDDEATTNAIFMANLSPVGSLNDDTVAPRYDSDTLSESYDELIGNNNVISYTDYMLTIRDDADNYVPPPVQKNDIIRPVTVSKLKVFPKKLSSNSQVLRNSNSARDLLTKFDECIKRITTLSPYEIGSWEQSDIKGSFKVDVIPFSKNIKETFKLFEKGFITRVKEMKDIFKQMEDEVDHGFVTKKSFEIEKK